MLREINGTNVCVIKFVSGVYTELVWILDFKQILLLLLLLYNNVWKSACCLFVCKFILPVPGCGVLDQI